jgi:hypothetical protein
VPWIFHFRIVSVFLTILSLLMLGCVKTSVVAAPLPPRRMSTPVPITKTAWTDWTSCSGNLRISPVS